MRFSGLCGKLLVCLAVAWSAGNAACSDDSGRNTADAGNNDSSMNSNGNQNGNSNVNSNANQNGNSNENSNANENNTEPPLASACGQWAEGTMDQDDGATRDFYNRGARLPWENSMGDWDDANGNGQGDAPFAVHSVADDGQPGYEEWDVTELVQDWVAGRYANKGFYLRSVGGGGTFNFYSKEHPVEAERPQLVVVTSQGTTTLEPEADSSLDSSTYQCFGDEDKLTVSDGRPLLVRFDLSEFSADEVVETATLRLYCFEDYGGSALDVGVFRSSQGLEQAPTDPEAGLAGGYLGDDGIASDPNVILFSDFESADWAQDWTSGTSGHSENMDVVSEDSDRLFEPLSGSALRIRIAAGDHYGASFAFKFADELGAEPEEIYFRYYLRFADDWEPSDTGKLPGISGTYGVAGWGGRPSDGTNGWSARGTFRPQVPMGNPFGGDIVIGNYVYHADMEGQYGDLAYWINGCRGVLERNRWYSVEQYVKLNTPGQKDGIIRAWIDGRLAYEATDWRFRTVDSLKIEQVWMDFYHGGAGVPDHDIFVYVDNVVIATSYIGPMGE